MLFYIISILTTQSPDIKWGRIFGGDSDDYARAVIECSDKGYIAVGSTNSFGHGGYDIYVFKVDSLGYPVWSKAFGGAQNDFGFAICPANDNNYLVVGTTYSFGHSYSDIILIKINEDGDSIWIKTYGDSLEESGYSIVPTYDNKYIICGTTNSSGAGNNDVFLIKIDSVGGIIWSRIYGGSLDDCVYCVDKTYDNGCIITGETYSFGNGGTDVYTLKIDSLGGTEWTALYGSYLDEKGYCVKQTADSGYIVCGTVYFTLLGYEWCLLRYNRRGALIWNTSQGSLNNDTAFSVQEVGQNNYVIGGNFSYEMYVVRTDTSGLNIWMLLYGGPGTDCAYSVKKTSDNGYIFAGITNSYGAGDNNAYLVKTYTDQIGIGDSNNKDIEKQMGIIAFPSPFRNKLYIRFVTSGNLDLPDIRIYDIGGRFVKKLSPIQSGTANFVWDGTNENENVVSAGIYFIYAKNLKKKLIKTVIKL